MVDILVVGATGYSGKLIVRYLAVHRDRSSFSIGLAGRSDAKLRDLVSNVGISSVETYTVDTRDSASVDELLRAARPRVVIAAVGPYVLYGLPLARACAAAGIHYIDITGETSFVYSLINELDYLATKTHAVLIPSCGFDSVPSDALAFLSARTLTQSLPLNSVDHHGSSDIGVVQSHTMYRLVFAGPSGGSFATILANIDKPRKFIDYPDILSPVPAPRDHQKLIYTFPAAARSNAVGSPFPLAPHNIAMVQRTRGLFTLQSLKTDETDGEMTPSYARSYSYSESVIATSRLTALLSGLGLALQFAALMFFRPLRWFAARAFFAPGTGPSDEKLEKGYFKARNVSVSGPIPGRSRPLVVESTLHGKGDPYALTAVFASEAALALLGPRENLPALAQVGGVLTPATALGTALIKRLSATGRFEFESELQE